MEELRGLVASGDHEKILALEATAEIGAEELAGCRAVAAIQLGRFEEAARIAPHGSFEQGYALYREKRFRKALRTLKESGPRCDILRAQCLYNLGLYGEAHKLLSSHGRTNEYAVNLAAIESLGALASELRFSPSFVAPPFRGAAVNAVRPTLTDRECAVEYEFNKAYENISDEGVYHDLLYKISQKLGAAGAIFKKQLLNLRGELRDDPAMMESLTRREKEIVDFNAGSGPLSCPVHFQANFVPGTPQNAVLESILAEKSDPSLMPSKRYTNISSSIQPVSEAISIVKALSHVKKTNNKISSDYIARILKDVGPSPEREILLLVASDLSDPEFQARAMELIGELSNVQWQQ